ncbi:histone methyltransferase set1 [Tilletia horrida]|nr:histone methyltransferase set1 [Tilletia horrida]
MASSTKLPDDVRAAVNMVAEQHEADSAWMARFDRHVEQSRSKRVGPASKRSTSSSASAASLAAIISGSAGIASSSAAAAPASTSSISSTAANGHASQHALPSGSPSSSASSSLLPPASKPLPTGPSLLQRIDALSASASLLPGVKRSIVERAGGTTNSSTVAQGSSKDLEPKIPSSSSTLKAHPSLPKPPATPLSSHSTSPGSSSQRPRKSRSRWDDGEHSRRDTYEPSESRSQSHRSRRHGDDDEDADYYYRERSSRHHRSTRSREDEGHSGSTGSSRHVHRPRDVWEAPPRDRHERERRYSHSEHSRSESHHHSSPLVPEALPNGRSSRASLDEERNSASQSHRKQSSYGGPLPSPPHHPPPPASSSVAASAPPPPSLPPPVLPPQPRGFVHVGFVNRPPKPSHAEISKPEPEPLVPLPHELPFDPNLRNYIAWPPPSTAALAQGLSRTASADDKQHALPAVSPRFAQPPADGPEGSAPPVKDPRLKMIAENKYGTRGRKKVVKELATLRFARDVHSVDPPPPTAVFVTGFGDQHGEQILSAYFQKYGKPAERLAELDKDIGTKMPFLWMRYEHDFDAKGRVNAHLAPGIVPRDGAKLVRTILREMDGFQLPKTGSSTDTPLVLRVRADGTGEKYHAAFAAEMHRRRLQRQGEELARASDHSRHANSPLVPAHAAAAPSPHAHFAALPNGSRAEHGSSIPNGRPPATHVPTYPSAAAATAAMGAGPGPRPPHGWNGSLQHPHVHAQQYHNHHQGYPQQHQPPSGPSRWNVPGPGAEEGGMRDFGGLPKGHKAALDYQNGRAEAWNPLPSKPVRVGRLGGVPPPVSHSIPPLPTEEVLRRLAFIARPYFRWPKGTIKIKFSEIKATFGGNANIELLEQDDAYFYCCLKSDSLTDFHRQTPVRRLRGGEDIRLECMPPATAASASETAKEASQMVLNQLADALVSTAQQRAEQHLEGLLRNTPHPIAAVDAMAMLANSGSISTGLSAHNNAPLPSIRRREHIPEEEQDQDDVLPPAKIRKVLSRSARDAPREYRDYRAGSFEPHAGRGAAAGKCSSPNQVPVAQATPTESTRMGDTDDDDVGDIKDDETQTTEEMIEERAGEEEKKRGAAPALGAAAGARGVKRSLKQIFSSDEEDGDEDASASENNEEEVDDDDDDDSCVSKSLMSFKPSPKGKRHSGNNPRHQVEETDDVLASMLLETVASMEPLPVHNVALHDRDEDEDSEAEAEVARRPNLKQPSKAAAKANKKVKTSNKKEKAAVANPSSAKGKTALKSKPEPIQIVAPQPEPEVAIVVTKPDEPDTPSESVPPTPVDGTAPGARGVAAPKKSDPRTKKGRRERARSPSPDPFALNIAQNEEDLYFLRLACERIRDGLGVGEEDVPEMGEDETVPAHTSGSARTEGYYKIPASQKAAHLPDRNQAIAEETTGVRTVGTARGNRAESRRVLMNIELHKKESATDTDILKFNQLSARKKQLKFAKSPIHDWGLYAMELIPAGDMVIEYVGEVIRQQVADEREKRYERQGQYSTYLFRVDDELVVDATMKGNIARLMNHCCTPNCNAKILTVNGEKRIALFAKSTIYPGQELTYDYKFQSTGDDADQIACLCGSANCRKFL